MRIKRQLILLQVGSSIGRLQEDAKAIKDDLSAAHSQHKSRQTSKILSDFEVSLTHTCLSPSLTSGKFSQQSICHLWSFALNPGMVC